MVISRAAAAGDETVAVVKVAGGEVDSRSSRNTRAMAERRKPSRAAWRRRRRSPCGGNRDGRRYSDFRFAGGLAGGDEADELAIAFNFANEDTPRFSATPRKPPSGHPEATPS